MWDWLVRLFLKIAEKIVIFLGKIHLPWTKQILKAEQIRGVLYHVKQGDILVVRAGGYFTSWLLGDFSHVAFVLNNTRIFDAKGIGVSEDDILTCLIGYTRVVVVRPRFTTIEKRKAMDRVEQLKKADQEENIKYNYSLVEGNEVSQRVPDRATCSQLVRDILNHGKENFMDLRKRFGFMSISPEDFYLAKSKFDEIYDTEK